MTKATMDPLMQALIDRVPNPEEDWTEDAQFAWLEMLAHSMTLIYGGRVIDRLRPHQTVEAQPPANVLPMRARTSRPAPEQPDTRPEETKFHIDQSGFVRNTRTGQPVNVADVEGFDIFDTRGEKSDFRTLIWANGDKGLQGFEGQILS